jgi:hypothetical protein
MLADPSPKPSKLEELILRMRQGEPIASDVQQKYAAVQSLMAPPPGPSGGGGGGRSLDSLAGGTGRISTDVLLPGDPLLRTKKGDTLQKAAMRSLMQIKRETGLPVFQIVGSSYRTPEEQAALYKQKPGLAAPPGQSLHQRGLAVDLRTDHPLFEKLRQAMLAAGWNQFDAGLEPWHLSYRETG